MDYYSLLFGTALNAQKPEFSVGIEVASPPVRVSDKQVKCFWKGLIKTNNPYASYKEGDAWTPDNGRMGCIFLATNKANIIAQAKSDVAAAFETTEDIDATVTALNAAWKSGGILAVAYILSATKHATWNIEKSAFSYKYDSNIPNGKKRAVIMFINYKDVKGKVHTRFSSLLMQTANA